MKTGLGRKRKWQALRDGGRGRERKKEGEGKRWG